MAQSTIALGDNLLYSLISPFGYNMKISPYYILQKNILKGKNAYLLF